MLNDKRFLWAAAAAGAYVLFASGGKVNNIGAILKDHGLVAALIGAGAFLLLTKVDKPATGVAEDIPGEPRLEPPTQQSEIAGYRKIPHVPVAGFDANFRALGV